MSEPSRPRVVAVVVTFDRIALLRPLVERLLAVEELDEVLVVDNASTDGTGEWLAGLGHPRVRSRTLATNSGGAGGFHDGLAWAMQPHEGRRADLAWLMDDDGMPEPGCLASLLAHRDDLDFWGPLVVDQDEPDRLVYIGRAHV